jgi:hypothetical protein
MAIKTVTMALGTGTAITDGSAWTVTFSVEGTTAVNAATGFTISASIPNLPSLFTVNSVNRYSGSGVNYVTWRSTTPPGQHPTSGLSLDIWNDTLYTDVNGGIIWDNMNGKSYPLYTNKYSLIYNYDSFYAPIFSKGGTLTITVA